MSSTHRYLVVMMLIVPSLLPHANFLLWIRGELFFFVSSKNLWQHRDENFANETPSCFSKSSLFANHIFSNLCYMSKFSLLTKQISERISMRKNFWRNCFTNVLLNFTTRFIVFTSAVCVKTSSHLINSTLELKFLYFGYSVSFKKKRRSAIIFFFIRTKT